MIAYEGKDPYIFVSYSHRDMDTVMPIIAELKRRMCRVWFDEGLTPGESWNDSIAEHLLGCAQFVVFISPDSVNSKYVMSEVNFAISKNKEILPVVIKDATLPAGLEMMLSTTQFLNVTGGDTSAAAKTVAASLVKSVFSHANMPFLQDLGYSFFMKTQDVDRREIKEKSPATIFYKKDDGEETEIFKLQRLGAYDAFYRISSVDAIKDYFFPGRIRGAYQINVLGYFNLEYPLYGPDVDVLLIFVLRIPRHGEPTLKLVDYQYIDSVSSLNCPEFEDLDVVGEKGWSAQLKSYLEEILYK